MTGRCTAPLLAALAAFWRCGGELTETPGLTVDLAFGSGPNRNGPGADAGVEVKYFVNFNQGFKDATDKLFCKGQVMCTNDKSRLDLTKGHRIKEDDILYFYLLTVKGPEGFQMERVYQVVRSGVRKLEFQQKSERIGPQKEGLWYNVKQLDELPTQMP